MSKIQLDSFKNHNDHLSAKVVNSVSDNTLAVFKNIMHYLMGGVTGTPYVGFDVKVFPITEYLGNNSVIIEDVPVKQYAITGFGNTVYDGDGCLDGLLIADSQDTFTTEANNDLEEILETIKTVSTSGDASIVNGIPTPKARVAMSVMSQLVYNDLSWSNPGRLNLKEFQTVEIEGKTYLVTVEDDPVFPNSVTFYSPISYRSLITDVTRAVGVIGEFDLDAYEEDEDYIEDWGEWSELFEILGEFEGEEFEFIQDIADYWGTITHSNEIKPVALTNRKDLPGFYNPYNFNSNLTNLVAYLKGEYVNTEWIVNNSHESIGLTMANCTYEECVERHPEYVEYFQAIDKDISSILLG